MLGWLIPIFGILIANSVALAGIYLQNHARTDKHTEMLFEKRLEVLFELVQIVDRIRRDQWNACMELKTIKERSYDEEGDFLEDLHELEEHLRKADDYHESQEANAHAKLKTYFPPDAFNAYVVFENRVSKYRTMLTKAAVFQRDDVNGTDLTELELNSLRTGMYGMALRLIDTLRKSAGVTSTNESMDDLLGVERAELREATDRQLDKLVEHTEGKS